MASGKCLERRVTGIMNQWLRHWLPACVLSFCCAPVSAQEIAISYPGLSWESSTLWMAREGGFFKENSVDAKLIYMEGGRLSIQSLLSGHTQFMAGDAVSALSAVGAGADIVLLASAKNILPLFSPSPNKSNAFK